MGLTKLVLKRPVTAILAVMCLIVYGLQAIGSTKMELMPSTDMPMLIISTTYTGASAEDVNDLVTTEIEDSISALSGIDSISSTSSENTSMIVIEYDYGTDLNDAYDDLSKKIDIVESSLPDDCSSPTIIELNSNETTTMSLAINHATEPDLYNYVNNTIVPELEKISTISDVGVTGGQEAYIQVELQMEKLEQYGLTMSSIATTIGSANLVYPAGTISYGGQELSVSAKTEYDTTELLKMIPIVLSSGQVIYLEDVATITDAKEDVSSISRYNGNDTISIDVTKQQDATAAEVSESVTAVINELIRSDQNLEIIVISDTSESIMESLQSVVETMILAMVVSFIIVFLFFGELKASAIIGTSIPISIMVALILMNLYDLTLNIFTLSGLVLGVGMMVDSSVVVLESCFRSTKGKGIVGYREAALEGSSLVIQSVIASTMTTCVVFIPLITLDGMSGQMFEPLGLTIIFCMLGSLLSAITVVPLFFCLFRPQERSTSPVNTVITKMQDHYREIMKVILPKRKTVVAITVGLLGVSIAMATQLQTELMASDDTGTISVSIETRPGLEVEELDVIFHQVEDLLIGDENIESYFLKSSGGSGMFGSSGSSSLTVYLKDEREKETDELVEEWRTLLSQVTNASISVSASSSMSMMTSNSTGIDFILESSNYDDLKAASDAIAQELMLDSQITGVSTSLDNAAPVVTLDIDAAKAYAHGITPLEIASTVNSTLSGKEATTLDVDGDEVSVMVEYPDGLYDSIDELEGILFQSASGSYVPLTEVATVIFADSPASIVRSDRQYQVTIEGEVDTADTRAQQEIKTRLNTEIVAKYLTSSVTQTQNAMDAAMAEEFTTLGIAILTAVFLIFVVMASQFESPKFSIMVMTTIPFALIGSFALLYITDVSISMTSLLGFLMLVGTVVNNGILYVDTVNYYRQTMDLDTALIEAGATRLRPILITTLTTMVSMVPISFAYGSSGSSMQGLGIVNIGGLAASTLLALLMLPAYYSLMSGKKKKEPHYD